MFINGTLFDHLKDVDISANFILKQVIKVYAEVNVFDEKLKASDQIRWVGLMNNYRRCAEKNSDLIYV